MLTRRLFVSGIPASFGLGAPVPAPEQSRIRRIDIYHLSHTDVGFTDAPSVCRDMQRRFLDVALDTCRADPRFRWTAESMLGVDDWWRSASPERRELLVQTIREGRIDVMAVAFNQAPFMNALQWGQALEWVPEDVWNELNPRAAIQDDVNGFPRAGAMRMADRGIRHLLMGINNDSGGSPFPRPTAFWWKMPDGRRIFVWLGDHYSQGPSYFEDEHWGRGGSPGGSDTALRPPRRGDFNRTDENSLRAAHRHLMARLAKLEAQGYGFERLIIPYTNQWRYDNDPPFPPLADFVEAWNRLALQPVLRLTTATDAVFAMEREVGDRVPVHEGEWTDWWANGDASGPREVAASRVAKRYLAAAMSPVWGPMPAEASREVACILKDLCLFDEHTWGAAASISQPESLAVLGQYTEKSILAYRPMGRAGWLLGRRARTALDPRPEGLYVANTAPESYTGWVRFNRAGLRQEARSVEELKTGRKAALRDDGQGVSMFWAAGLPPASVTAWRLAGTAASETPVAGRPAVERSPEGWPVSARWDGMTKPLFRGDVGHFLSVGVIPPANRRTILRMHEAGSAGEREELRRKSLVQTAASYGETSVEETAFTMVYRQPVEHARLRDASRALELWKGEPRARLTVTFDRTSSTAPEVFYLGFGLPAPGLLPTFSNGGVPFVPYRDQLEGTCRDYFAIDGWARYTTDSGDWLWVTSDAPIVAVGGPHTVERHTTPPADSHRLTAILFDNFWHTNFVADSHGRMTFRFDLLWREHIDDPGRTAETLASEPVVLINPAARESPELLRDLFRP